jgi:trehalose/maltose hydrolase-like predicted phosphorylase
VIELRQGETLAIEKLTSIYTSRDHAVSECGLAAREAIEGAGRFEDIMAEHAAARKYLWRRFDVYWVLARPNRPRALRYFEEALQSDLSDIQKGTAAEGVHLGAIAATVDLMQRATMGIEVTKDVLRLNPRLPQEMERLETRIRYRGHSLSTYGSPATS